jgi:hypothetical protein
MSPSEHRSNSTAMDAKNYWHAQPAYHQNYPNYYNDYLGSQMQQQIVIKTEMVASPKTPPVAYWDGELTQFSLSLFFFCSQDPGLTESGWMKSREDSNWFYNSPTWDAHKGK